MAWRWSWPRDGRPAATTSVACRLWCWCRKSSMPCHRHWCSPRAASSTDGVLPEHSLLVPMASGSGRGSLQRSKRRSTPNTSGASFEGKGEQTVRSSIFGPEWPHFNPMRVLRNRVVDEWTDRLAEVPMVRDDFPVIGRTVFLGQGMEMRKFNVILPTDDTEGDWEEMPWLAGQGVGLIHDIRPAKEVVETMMADARAILKRLSVSL